MDVVKVQETYFTCTEDCQVLEDEFVVFLAFSSCCNLGISLLVRCSLNAIVNLVFADDRGQLVVSDVAIKSFKFWVVMVYVLNIIGERCSFFQWLVPFPNDPKQLVLMGDWLVGFNGISTSIGYLMPKPVYTYYMYSLLTHNLMITY